MTATTTPPGAGTAATRQRQSRNYIDANGKWQKSRIPVPVNEFGQLTQQAWKCRKCTELRWFPLNVKQAPVCPVHDRMKLTPASLKRPPMLPYRALWDVCEKPLRPVWALPGLAAAGLIVDAADIPELALAAAAPVAFELSRRVVRARKVHRALAKGDLEQGDLEYGKRLRQAIDRAARQTGYTAGGITAWLAAVAALGLDPHTAAGKVAWSLSLAPWLPWAATYLRILREARKPRPVPAEQGQQPPVRVDTDEQRILRIWKTGIGAHAGDVIGVASDGVTPIKALQAGKLAGTNLVGWATIRGGWKATIVGPPGVFDSDAFLAAKAKIASTYSVTKAMVSLVPDGQDENRCALFVQKASVIGETVPWTGPSSVNAETGLAPMVKYVDGTYGMYEIYRPGWGCPHEIFIGTTGAAKSSALELVFAIDRWAQYKGQGLVADFLIDPQQGQSFGAFAEDLAAPVASTADEAMMLARAFRREMLRRNKYLSRKRWIDGKSRERRGMKWWNPLVEGPMLFLTIDEAHEFLAIREFAALITAGGRMFRKCGMKLRVATHTPLLTDLGGSMALRDMLTGGFVWCGRTANGLSGPTAFNGRLPADPKTIPEIPGAAFILSAREKKPMLSRTMCGPINDENEPDLYDYVRDSDNNPIGFPGVVRPETLAAFGQEYADWLAFMAAEAGDDDEDDEPKLWTPAGGIEPVKADRPDEYLYEMVLWALEHAEAPLDMNGIDEALHVAEVEASALAVREVLTMLRGQGRVVSRDGRHELSPQAKSEMEAKLREAQQQVDEMLAAEEGER